MANYRIRAATTKTAEIFIYDDIGEGWFGGVSAKQFADDLKPYAGFETLKIRVNSPGGDVFDALAIYNVLKRHPATKEISIDGMALSAASIVIMAASPGKLTMAENAMLMIHDPWSVTMGTAEDMRVQADLLDQVKENIVVTYERRTKRDGGEIATMMGDETWMRAQQALDEGFIDEITADLKVSNSFDPNRYRYRNTPPEYRRASVHTPLLDVRRARVAAMKATAEAMRPT